ncbi:polysaccharide biosynthesis protein [Metasolibacillus sp.]|uniref:putative polysaccharide biosynthesis protein n=1 Tax=Metasolibacillus sp. TaxID=2703680 RepID=UPI0025ED0BB6|nr:polysaccharide biosynthesis protein [Metasolibacillus sp.]MCT6925069.1 polysaccharide biosynthesis protein [Metasolibacillus sp.]MCT6941238.1 polysaccharide biosynthesis protein [Metasolibacillus sp.]
MSSLMKGTAILTIGLFLSKLLGLVYLFPFYAIVGEENMALYQYAYIPYTIMLSIAISGLPLAVSKFVAKYNALGDYKTGVRLMKSGTIVMLLTGLASFILLNLLATPLANMVIKDDEQLYSVEQIASVIRWVSYALLVVPLMSLIRGYFQGYGHYMPTSVSQLIEQIARIVVLLGGSFVVVVLFGGLPETAIKFAVFAAFIGALGGLFVLYHYWKKLKPEFRVLQANSIASQQVSYSEIYKEIFTYSIPIIFVGIANPLFQLVDMLTFNGAMIAKGVDAKLTDIYFLMLNLLTHKIVIIPVMLATGLSMALIPTITKYFTLGQLHTLRSTMDKMYQVLLFVTIPAVVGIMILAPSLYHVLYEQSENGAMVLMHYAPAAILFAIFSVTASLLQGINYQKWIIFSLLTGILVKLVLNIPLIKWLEVDGAILATMIGYAVTCVINITVIHRTLQYNAKVAMRRILLICILTIVMTLVVSIIYAVLQWIAPADSKMLALVYLLICAAAGAGVYGYLSLRLGLAQKLLGARVKKIADKLGMN